MTRSENNLITRLKHWQHASPRPEMLECIVTHALALPQHRTFLQRTDSWLDRWFSTWHHGWAIKLASLIFCAWIGWMAGQTGDLTRNETADSLLWEDMERDVPW